MIKQLKEQGWSIHKISRELSISRRIVRKYLRSPEKPTYHRSQPYKSKLDSYQEYIGKRLEQCSEITAERIWREIKSQGFSGSYRIVAEYVSKNRPQQDLEAFLRYESSAGEWSQVDWGEFGEINYYGKKQKLYCFSMVLGYSRAQYIEFTVSADIYALMNCHLHAFNYLGGVSKKILYDNMKSVCIFNIEGYQKFNDKFMDFAGHYGFIAKLCEPQSPQQKGKVERSIGYIRSSFFVGSEWQTLEELNSKARDWLDTVCNHRIHQTTLAVPFERLKEEQNYLTSISETPYDTARIEFRKAHKDCFFCFGGNCYSVPDKYVRKTVLVKAEPEQIRVYFQDQQIAQHKICRMKGQYIRDEQHFAALRNRPRAKSPYHQIFSNYGQFGETFFLELIKANYNNPYHHLRQITQFISQNNITEDKIQLALEKALKYQAFNYKTFKNIIQQLKAIKTDKLTLQLNLTLCGRCQPELEEVQTRPLQYYEFVTQEKNNYGENISESRVSLSPKLNEKEV